MSELFKLWSLRTHPFRPETDSEGGPFEPGVWRAPLDPTRDPRVVPFYYDIYDWSKSAMIRRLSPHQLFENFPEKNDIAADGSIMVMIAGADKSGRKSLQNLILHKIEAQYGERPLKVESTLGKNLLENLNSIRALFQFEYSEQVRKPSNAELDKVRLMVATEAEGNLSVEAYGALFKMWRTLTAKSNRPFVLIAAGGEYEDLWRQIYSAASVLFDFVIVVTKNVIRAESCARLLKIDGRNSAVIKAEPLRISLAERYVRSKLDAQRFGQAPANLPLAPFAEKAIDVLYEPGPTAERREDVSWSVGWLNTTLGRALDEHLRNLLKRQNDGTDLSALPINELLIDGAAIKSAREGLNQGN